MSAFKLLLCSAFLLGNGIPNPEDRVFTEQGQRIDSFLIRTASRISEAWSLCREEFRLASEAAVNESSDFIRAEVEKQTEAAILHAKEKAADTVEDRIRMLIPEDASSGEKRLTDPGASGPAAGSVSPKSAQ